MNKPKLYFKTDKVWNISTLNEMLYSENLRNKNNQITNILSISNKNGFIKQDSQFENRKIASENTSNYKIVNKNTFGYNPARINVGSIAMLENDIGIISPMYIVFKCCSDINPYFFKQYITSELFKTQVLNNLMGSVRLCLNFETLCEFKFNYPTMDIQQKISTFLSDLDLKIEHESQIIEQLKQLKKSLLYKMFPIENSNVPELRFKGFTETWEQRKLGEISDSYSGGTPTVGKKEYYGGDIPFIRSGEISSDKTELFITNEGINNSSAKMVTKGDILYALYGATSGEVSISKIKGAINQAILAIQPHQNYDSQFIMQWLRKSKENIISTYLQGGQGNLSGNIIKELLIDLPNYDEQQQIGQYFQNLDNLITLHQYMYNKLFQVKNDIFPHYSAYYNNILHNFLPIIFTYSQPQYKSHTKKNILGVKIPLLFLIYFHLNR